MSENVSVWPAGIWPKIKFAAGTLWWLVTFKWLGR
jgi:hypothetical protein